MKCYAITEDAQSHDLFFSAQAVDVQFVNRDACRPGDADVVFDLRPEVWDMEFYASIPQNPIFIANVVDTLFEHQASPNMIRINTWGDLTRERFMECVGDVSFRERATSILSRLNKDPQWVPDVPGMVNPRILAMLINESFFIMEEGLATADEIDEMLMKELQYPFGPCARGNRIGLKRIVALLQKLESENPRYSPCPLLQQSAFS